MNFRNLICSWVLSLIIVTGGYSQGVLVSSTPDMPHPSAGLEVRYTDKGLLPPRMTTAQRDAIASPEAGLRIYNTISNCENYFNGTVWREICGDNCSPVISSGITGPSEQCAGNSAEVYSILPVPDASGYNWSVPAGWTINSGSGTTSIAVSVGLSGASGEVSVAAVNGCGAGTPVGSVVTVNQPPVAASAAIHSASAASITWNWNLASGAEGYKWSNSNDFASATDLGNALTLTQSGLSCGMAYILYLWAYNGCGASSVTELTQSTTMCFMCGVSTVEHNSLTYGTISRDYGGGNVKCWLDRNLGATAVCTSYDDTACFGDLYQWGRLDDGHQSRTSGTISTLSNTDSPGHSDFIMPSTSPNDWRSPQNENLWQGVSGVNNPCPAGWRLPLEAELENERASWSQYNYLGAMESPLKLSAGGRRQFNSGELLNVTSFGYYWSSTYGATNARSLYLPVNDAYMANSSRGQGMSVRCIMD